MRTSRLDTLAARSLGPFFVFAGAMHFVLPEKYEAIVPPWAGDAHQIVAFSGVAEIAGGAAAIAGAPRLLTRWWLIALLVAVFPANLYMALNPEEIAGLSIPRWTLWARLPLQGLFIAWVVRGTR